VSGDWPASHSSCFTLWKESPVITTEDEWASGPVWIWWKRKNWTLVIQSVDNHWSPYWPLLTPWSTVLIENLTVTQLVMKFPAFYGTLRFITMFTRACSGPCLQLDESSPHLSTLRSKIHSNIIIPPKPNTLTAATHCAGSITCSIWELHNSYSAQNNIRVIDSRRVRWVSKVAHMVEMRNGWPTLVTRHEGNDHLGNIGLIKGKTHLSGISGGSSKGILLWLSCGTAVFHEGTLGIRSGLCCSGNTVTSR
jgi:hypothetical protein